MKLAFSVDPAALGALSPQDAVDHFRLLLLAEGHRLGVDPTAINVPSATTVADGGIDATVVAPQGLPGGALIACGTNRYQIKTGDSFKPWQPAAIHDELFGAGNDANKENLGPAVGKCLDDGGCVYMICFGLDIVAKDLDKAQELLREAFAKCGYKDPRVKVLGQAQLRGLLEQYPARVRSLSSSNLAGARDHRSWASDAEMSRPFEADERQSEVIELLRTALRGRDGTHIRVYGEPGIGKTRLVLEATRESDLAARVLYCHASELLGSPLLQALGDDSGLYAILIVDECDDEARERLQDRLSRHSDRIRIVSIYQEHDQSSGLNLVAAPPLAEDAIVKIIATYGAPDDAAKRWAPLCDGSPRVAHVIGQNLLSNPADILKPPSTNNLWERYVLGGREANDPRADQIRTVLRHLSLFQRFGFEEPVSDEAKAIAAIIERADPSITWFKFRDLVAELRSRRILQGDRTLYITPKALHIWLWSEWWKKFGAGFDLDEFADQLVGELLQWFIDMWRFAHRSKEASTVVGRLLGPGGPFAEGTLLRSELGSRFLLALTDADPEAALACLERTVGASSQDELLEFSVGRRSVIHALERITMWQTLFSRGARLLLALAAAENEKWANNATGVFAELFSPGIGAVAPTEAGPEERLPVLKEALEAPEASRREVGLKAADCALESDHFSRTVGAEYQGLRAPPQLWAPKTWGEVFDAYRGVWRLLESRLRVTGGAERAAIVAVMLRRARRLIRFQSLASECFATVRVIAESGWATPKEIVDVCEDLLHYHQAQLVPEIVSSLVALRDEMIGPGFAGRLRRVIGMRRLEDDFEEGQHTGKWEASVDALAAEALKDRRELRQQLGWLVSKDAENAWSLGQGVGRGDKGRQLLREILDATSAAGANRSWSFLTGYLRAMFEQDPAAWEDQLDRLAEDPDVVAHLPEITWRSGMSDRSAQRLTRLLRAGGVTPMSLGVLRFGSALEPVSEMVFVELVEALLSVQSPDASALAVELLYQRIDRGGASGPRLLELADQALTDPHFFEQPSGNARSTTGYVWSRLALLVLAARPEAAPRLLALIIDQANNYDGMLFRHHVDLGELAHKILAVSPDASWKVILGRLESGDKEQVRETLDWLGGGLLSDREPGLWHLIRLDEFWSWVERRPDDRAWRVASVARRTLDRDGGGQMARELLIHFGDRDDVRRNLLARFMTGSWMGDASEHFAAAKRVAEEWRTREVEPRVKEWLSFYIGRLEKEIEAARIREERGHF